MELTNTALGAASSANHVPSINYLGPAGTYTYQAAQQFARVIGVVVPPIKSGAALVETTPRYTGASLGVVAPPVKPGAAPVETTPPPNQSPIELTPQPSVAEVFAAVEADPAHLGVAALDNTVEGPVFATIDGLLTSANVVAIAAIVLPVTFDAYQLVGTQTPTHGTAHPHALAQVSRFLAEHQLAPLPASSNMAAVENLAAGQIAFGPPGHQADGVEVVARNVGDYPTASTQFVLLAERDRAVELLRQNPVARYQSMIAITPRATGPGVLARITAQFAERSINLSSLISRPLKAQDGQYVFVVTMDAPPWAAMSRALLADLLAADDAVKTLGVWAHAVDEVGSVLPAAIPPSSALGTDSAADLAESLLW